MIRIVKTLFSYLKITPVQHSLDTPDPAFLPQAQAGANMPFIPLTPVDNADPLGEYTAALDWALKKQGKGEIKNIALTGPYGSGKSSILKTYQLRNAGSNLSFLNISLATFKEELGPDSPTNSTDLLRLIELSILQQIFYHEEDHKIPDSRFKKIRSFNRKTLVYNTVGIFLTAVSSIYLYDKKFFETLTGYYSVPIVEKFAPLLALAIVSGGILYTIFKSIRTISNVTVSKLNFQSAEIEISDSISKSILNNHLDEILYFFEVTKYSIVIIEDLDRFEQTEIFTKLRELNHLLNYSEKIKRDIVFIYAVRDDIFKDKDRTKFFDFIIPVIPVINSSNSNEKLLDIITKNSYEVRSELIENISLFIDDLRLLYNITNEYHIYHKKLGKINQDRLFAMMVYKNMYPEDFVDLSNGKGKLFGVFAKKEIFISERTAEIEAEIHLMQRRLEDIDQALIIDKGELRMIYIYKYLENLAGISKFVLDGKEYNFSEVTTDDAFKYFIQDKVSYLHTQQVDYYGYRANTSEVKIKFDKIQSMISKEQTYEERLQIVSDIQAGKQNELKKGIRDLEAEKSRIRHLKIYEIVALGGCRMELEDKKQSQLVNILLRNGYIGEDYLDYISIFYEGSITKLDREFLLNVKAQVSSEFDYKLTKIDKLIPKIDLIDFSFNHILNFDLLEYILIGEQYEHQRTAIMQILGSETSESVSFVDGFIDHTANIKIFIGLIAKQWPGIWHFLRQRSNYPEDRLQLYLTLLMEYAAIDDIKAIARMSKLLQEISSNPNFLQLPVEADKLRKIIESLDLKFNSLNIEHAPSALTKYVYEQSHYTITVRMLKTVIKYFGEYNDSDFCTRNFFAIKNSGCPHLISYVEKNLTAYLTNVYLKLDQNTAEEEGALVELLNCDDLSTDLKEAILDKVTTTVTDVATIGSVDIVQSLLIRSRVSPVWQNLITYYESMNSTVDACLVKFLEDEGNADALSKKQIEIEVSDDELPKIKQFIRDILLEDRLTTEHYALILKSVPYYCNSLAFSHLSNEKVKLLIQNDKLGLTVPNYDLLRSDFNGQHILLAERKYSEFIQKIKEFVVEESEILQLFASNQVPIEEKNKIIDALGSEKISSTDKLLVLLGTLGSNDERLVIPDDVVLKILLQAHLQARHKIRLLVKYSDKLEIEQILQVLSSLPEPYSDITILGRRPKLEGEHLNWDLATMLVKRGIIKNATDYKGKIRISTYRQ